MGAKGVEDGVGGPEVGQEAAIGEMAPGEEDAECGGSLPSTLPFEVEAYEAVDDIGAMQDVEEAVEVHEEDLECGTGGSDATTDDEEDEDLETDEEGRESLPNDPPMRAPQDQDVDFAKVTIARGKLGHLSQAWTVAASVPDHIRGIEEV